MYKLSRAAERARKGQLKTSYIAVVQKIFANLNFNKMLYLMNEHTFWTAAIFGDITKSTTTVP